jgi:hypothetical protein
MGKVLKSLFPTSHARKRSTQPKKLPLLLILFYLNLLSCQILNKFTNEIFSICFPLSSPENNSLHLQRL